MGNESVRGLDGEFSFGLTSDAELQQALDGIISEAANYSEAVATLTKYFTDNSLWTGADAEELRTTVLAKNGPLEKLQNCEKEINNLGEMAKELRGAVSGAQDNLVKNVRAAMGAGTNG